MDSLVYPESILDSLENGHFLIDENLIVWDWNRWLSINTQISKNEIVGKSLEEFYPTINYKTLLRKIRTALKLNSPTFYSSNSQNIFMPIKRNKVTKTSLKLIQQQVTISPFILEKNMVMISIYDISELFEVRLCLQIEVEKVNKLNKSLEDEHAIVDKNIMNMKTDLDGRITDVSSLFCTFFEYNKNDIIGKNASILKGGQAPNLMYKELWNNITSKKNWSGEIKNKTASGKTKWVESRVSPILDDDGLLIGYNAVYFDIINKKLLESLYVTDSLTQIYNRTYFDGLMSDVCKYQRKADIDFVILIADIDFFKSINDNYGHQVGDEALKDVANALKKCLRDNDTIARWGGEEFVIMIKQVSINEAQSIAEKLRVKIENTKIQEMIDITVSFGLTKYDVGEDTNLTFKRADDALYEAKKTGRNKVVTKLL